MLLGRPILGNGRGSQWEHREMRDERERERERERQWRWFCPITSTFWHFAMIWISPPTYDADDDTDALLGGMISQKKSFWAFVSLFNHQRGQHWKTLSSGGGASIHSSLMIRDQITLRLSFSFYSVKLCKKNNNKWKRGRGWAIFKH